MTRQDVINELKDICAVIDEDGELVAEDSLDALASKLMEEGSEDISEKELDAINEMIYDSFVEPATICNELINMLMSSGANIEEVEDPLTADIWDDLSDEEVAALTADGPNYAEFSDHHYQEGCEGNECKEKVTEEKNFSIDSIEGRVQAYQNEIKTISDMIKDGVDDDLVSYVTDMFKEGNSSLDHRDDTAVLSWIRRNSKLSAEEFFKKLIDQMNDLIKRIQNSKTEDIDEAYYGKDSLIAGDIPGKENCFHELISMRFHNMGYDEDTYPLMPGSQSQMWNPFGQYSIVMYGPDAAFFDKIVAYIETEVNREDSAWYNRDYEVCQVEGREATDKGPWALCIECMPYDMDDVDLLPRKIRDEYARRRKLRRTTKPAA
jgi:hypothetical protein